MASNCRSMPSWMVSHTGTQVISLKVHSLRKLGYDSLEEWLENPDHVYIGRYNPYVKGANESKWANPFTVRRCPDMDRRIELYEDHVLRDKDLVGSLHELKGKTLGCWCAPKPCHGHVLQKLITKYCS
ncbi:hypothetical protein ScPMuIL_012507 [Solemya velum]